MHVAHHRLGWLASQDLLKMTARQPVLALQEERVRELEPHALQFRPVDQHDPVGGDRLVQQGVPRVLGDPRPQGCTDRRHADVEQHVGMDGGVLCQGAQDRERRLRLARVDQGLGVLQSGGGRHRSLRGCTFRGSREQDAGRECEGAAKGGTGTCCGPRTDEEKEKRAAAEAAALNTRERRSETYCLFTPKAPTMRPSSLNVEWNVPLPTFGTPSAPLS